MGEKTITEIEDQVKAYVKDTHLVGSISKFRDTGIMRYSKRRPRLVTVELTGDGNTYSALPTSIQGWEQDFSIIMGVEYPLDANPPTYLGDDYWIIHPTPSGDRIEWIGDSYPGTSENFWVSFIARHALRAAPNNTKYTFPDSDFEGVCLAIASIYAEALSRFYGGQTVPTLDADTVNHQSKAIDFQKLAKSLWEMFEEEIPMQGYSTIADWDRETIIGGTLTHEDKE